MEPILSVLIAEGIAFTIGVFLLAGTFGMMISGIIISAGFSEFLTSGELAARILTYVIGFLWSFMPFIPLLLLFYIKRPTLLIIAAYSFVIVIPTFIFVGVTSAINSNGIWKIQDVDTGLRIQHEEEDSCCYYTKYDNITRGHDYVLYYYFYVDCGALDQSALDINPSSNLCYYEDEDNTSSPLICRDDYLNSTTVDVCGGGNSLPIFIAFEIYIGLYGICLIILGILCIVLFFMTESEESVHNIVQQNIEMKPPEPNIEEEVVMATGVDVGGPNPVVEKEKSGTEVEVIVEVEVEATVEVIVIVVVAVVVVAVVAVVVCKKN
ncbi:hypothetical protein QTN25_006407 [Entamoeba marina]